MVYRFVTSSIQVLKSMEFTKYTNRFSKLFMQVVTYIYGTVRSVLSVQIVQHCSFSCNETNSETRIINTAKYVIQWQTIELWVKSQRIPPSCTNSNIISPSNIISTYGNIRRYPIAPFPLFVCACSALITWCFVYKVTNLSSSIKKSKMDIRKVRK